MKEIKVSPINQAQLKEFLTCTDYMVSNKEFRILQDPESGLLVTSPQPDPEELGSYYESEAYISHTDSRKTLFDKLYQVVKN